MTLAEKAGLLLSFYKIAFEEKNNNSVGITPYFFTIDNKDVISESTVSTNAVFDTDSYIIGCLRLYYNNYGYRNNYQVFVILDAEGKSKSKIERTNWVIDKIAFNNVGANEMPTPEITFSRTLNPGNHIKLVFNQAKKFQQIWDFFVTIDANDYTEREVLLFYKYYEEKAGAIESNKSIEEIRELLMSKDSIIEKYRELIKTIEDLVNRDDS